MTNSEKFFWNTDYTHCNPISSEMNPYAPPYARGGHAGPNPYNPNYDYLMGGNRPDYTFRGGYDDEFVENGLTGQGRRKKRKTNKSVKKMCKKAYKIANSKACARVTKKQKRKTKRRTKRRTKKMLNSGIYALGQGPNSKMGQGQELASFQW